MKIKMIQAGYESFTGVFGNVAFSGGVSADVSETTATSIGAMVLCERVDDVATPALTRTMQKAAAKEQAAAKELTAETNLSE